ncbi:surfeit locus 1 [Sulfurifustis variabilis]|uniref:SURF1-like protein n=1 Tax=Sulfurifustis variabilis TaxID=1675686 RepID=A0A1B4VAK7_9GAMM|nr:surfeit locus 1 [Sulfurifustis variabilis]
MVNVRRGALLPTLVALLLIPVFVFLGYWQLERAREKRDLQAEYDRRASQEPVRIGGEWQSAEEFQFYRVEATGRYDTEYQILLDNRVHRGAPGYHVLTPLRIRDSEMRVLVNRGWVPLGPDRRQLPAIETPTDALTVRGVATVPHEGFTLGEPSPLTRGKPTVWQQLDLERYTREVGFPVQPVVVLLDPQAPGGFVREWARLDTGIAVHQGYAFQWFALAAAAFVGYIALMRRYGRRARMGGDAP